MVKPVHRGTLKHYGTGSRPGINDLFMRYYAKHMMTLPGQSPFTLAKAQTERGMQIQFAHVKSSHLPLIMSMFYNAYGIPNTHALRIWTTRPIDKFPKVNPIFLFTQPHVVSFKAGLDLVRRNKGEIIKAWFMTGAKRVWGNAGLWQNEASLSHDRVSLNGVIFRTGGIDESIAIVEANASEDIKNGEFDFNLGQWGAMLKQPVEGAEVFEAARQIQRIKGSDDHDLPANDQPDLYKYEFSGLMKTSGIMNFVKTACAQPDQPLFALAVNQSTIMGFESGLQLDRVGSKFRVSYTLDNVSPSIEMNFTGNLRSSLSSSASSEMLYAIADYLKYRIIRPII